MVSVAEIYTIKTAQQKFSSVIQEAADHPVIHYQAGRWIYEAFQSRLME